MEELNQEEQKYFDMIKESDVKKISLNMGSETLNKVDELAELFKTTRTLIIEAILRMGMKPYLETVVSANKKLKKQYPENEKLDEMLKKIEEFNKKWPL